MTSPEPETCIVSSVKPISLFLSALLRTTPSYCDWCVKVNKVSFVCSYGSFLDRGHFIFSRLTKFKQNSDGKRPVVVTSAVFMSMIVAMCHCSDSKVETFC